MLVPIRMIDPITNGLQDQLKYTYDWNTYAKARTNMSTVQTIRHQIGLQITRMTARFDG